MAERLIPDGGDRRSLGSIQSGSKAVPFRVCVCTLKLKGISSPRGPRRFRREGTRLIAFAPAAPQPQKIPNRPPENPQIASTIVRPRGVLGALLTDAAIGTAHAGQDAVLTLPYVSHRTSSSMPWRVPRVFSRIPTSRLTLMCRGLMQPSCMGPIHYVGHAQRARCVT